MDRAETASRLASAAPLCQDTTLRDLLVWTYLRQKADIKKFYNTQNGKATIEQYIAHWKIAFGG